MRLEQLYSQEEMRSHCAENYCDGRDGVRAIIDRALNLGLTFRELDQLLASAHNRGMRDAA